MAENQKSPPVSSTTADGVAVAADTKITGDNDDNVDFVSSMTFAAKGRRRGASEAWGCDCDECGDFQVLPVPIQAAVEQYHRQRRQQVPLRRTQHRTLVKREGPVTVWQLILPRQASPLIEFGDNHRLIWIQHRPVGSLIKSIGKGVIGSQDEEQARITLEWAEGQIYLLPSNGGKAVGWVHDRDEEHDQDDSKKRKSEEGDHLRHDQSETPKEATLTSTAGNVVFYVVKIPSKSDASSICSTGIPWVDTLAQTCLSALAQIDAPTTVHPPSGYLLSSAFDQQLIKDCLL